MSNNGNNNASVAYAIFGFLLIAVFIGVSAAASFTQTVPSFYPGNVIDCGGGTITANTILSGGAPPYHGNWIWAPPLNSNVLIGNVPSLPIAADGNMPLTINPQCSQGFIQFSFEGNNYLTQATGATHSLLGVWTLYGNGIDSGSPANTVVGINTFTLNPQLQANLGAFEHFLEIGQSSIVSGFGSGGTPTQNPEPYTYTWYNGIVTGGYDQLQFSVTPPFPIPQQPAIGHPPKPMFWYQNPGNTLTITPYVWNALNPNGFFAVSTGNTLAIRAGNETALPAFVPSTFTVSSNRSDLSLNLPGGAYAPQFNPSSQVVYNLDAYSLVQSNTLAAGTVYAATTPYVINDLLAKYVGVNVVVTNDGISTVIPGAGMGGAIRATYDML